MYCRSKYNLAREFNPSDEAELETFWKRFAFSPKSFRRASLRSLGCKCTWHGIKVCFIEEGRRGIPFEWLNDKRRLSTEYVRGGVCFFGLFQCLLASATYLRIWASPKLQCILHQVKRKYFAPVKFLQQATSKYIFPVIKYSYEWKTRQPSLFVQSVMLSLLSLL